jgi:hypothetical protein
MDTRMQQHEARPARQATPAVVRGALIAFVAALLAGALYLISVRGEALLLDLSTLSQRVFCF